MAEQNGMAAMAAVVEQHRRFEPFVGTFKAEVKMWMGPGDPHVSTGVMTNTLALGGRFLHHNYKGDQQEGPFPNFEGRGYWGYNTITQKYEGVWIDTASTAMQTETGEVDGSGKVWNMSGTFTFPGGNTLNKRSVITLQDNDHHRMEMYMTGADGTETRNMEIRYQRVR